MKRKSNILKVYLIHLLTAGVLILISISCNESENVVPEHASLYDYDSNIQNLAMAVNRTMKASADFRKIIRHEAMKQLDGDYDVLLAHISENKLSDYNSLLKKSAPAVTIKDLLEDHLKPADMEKKSTFPSVEKILSENPEMQISVPVHCEKWDPESYMPRVAYLDMNYYQNNPEKVTAYDPDGELVEISAIEEPDEPVIVLGLNERYDRVIREPITAGQPETPTDLTGVCTEAGIRLSWKMSAESNSTNTTGYYIYRKGVYDAGFAKIANVYGCYNRSFDDNNVEPAKSYSYYVRAYYGSIYSGVSNTVTVTAPAKPKPVESFNVIQISGSRNELRWSNEYDQSFSKTEIYRYRQGVDNDYQLFRTFDPAAHYCFDDDLLPGKKFTYKIHHRSDLGLSNPKYDLVRIPYRDISKPSPVYIQGIRFHDWDIERWLAGKPEFYVTVGNVNMTSGKTYVIQEKIFLEFSSRKSTHMFPDILVFNWSPGIWYDMITFSVVEHDAGGTFEINFCAGFNSKGIEKMSLLPVSFGAEYTYEVGNGSENCGCSYLNYFDVPDAWLLFPNYGAELLVSEKKYNEILQTELIK